MPSKQDETVVDDNEPIVIDDTTAPAPSRDEDGNVNLDADTFFNQLRENRFELTSGSNVPPKIVEAATGALAIMEQLAGTDLRPVVLPGWSLDDLVTQAFKRNQGREYDEVVDNVISSVHKRCTGASGQNKTMHGRVKLDPWQDGHEDGLSLQLIYFRVNEGNQEMLNQGRHAAMLFRPASIRYSQWRGEWREEGSWFVDTKAEREDGEVPGYLGITHFFKSYLDMKSHMRELQQAARDWETCCKAIHAGQYSDDPIRSVTYGDPLTPEGARQVPNSPDF